MRTIRQPERRTWSSQQRKPRPTQTNRRGGAVTELAICLPIIVLLVFASIEACGMIFLRQALTAAAYEGVRVALDEKATNQQVEDRCQAILDGRKVKGSTIEIDAADISKVKPGKFIEVTVSAKCDANSAGPAWFFGGRTLTASAAMVKE